LVTVSGSQINHEIQKWYTTHTHTITHTPTHTNVGKREQAFRRLRVVANGWKQRKSTRGTGRVVVVLILLKGGC